jgi:hypothetical protein
MKKASSSSREESRELIRCSDCISLTTREYRFDGGPVVYTGSHTKTPRTPTIEANHIAYGVGDFAPSRKRSKTKTPTFEEMQRLKEEDRASRAEEARVRWDEYHRLDVESMMPLIKIVSDEEFVANDKEWGRQWCGSIGINDERTEGGVGINARRPSK